MEQSEQKINRLIGRRLRDARILRGVSLTQLSELIGHSYQAVQKYEKGETNMSAWKLKRLADKLGMPVGYFFDEPELAERDSELPPSKVLHLVSRLRGIEEDHPQVFDAICRMALAVAKIDK
jgi:transcriptional regulator with XRE-family HTH domain